MYVCVYVDRTISIYIHMYIDYIYIYIYIYIAVSCCILSTIVLLGCSKLCYAMQCYAMLCYAMLCYKLYEIHVRAFVCVVCVWGNGGIYDYNSLIPKNYPSTHHIHIHIPRSALTHRDGDGRLPAAGSSTW